MIGNPARYAWESGRRASGARRDLFLKFFASRRYALWTDYGRHAARQGHSSALVSYESMAFNPSSVSKVLVRATNWLGDAVMSLPAVRAIRAIFPHAHVTVVARPSVAGLYER